MLKFKKTIGGMGRKLQLVKLANSQTVEVGDVIETYTVGTGTLEAAGLPVLGVVQAICNSRGIPFKTADVVAGTASGTNVTSQATSTTGIYYALVDISRDTVYSAAVDGTIGTTVASTLRGCRLNVNSAGTEYGELLESTATRTPGTAGQFYSHGVDPEDSTRLLVSIALSELVSDVD